MYRAGDLGHVTAVDSGACSNLEGSLSQAKVLAAATPCYALEAGMHRCCPGTCSVGCRVLYDCPMQQPAYLGSPARHRAVYIGPSMHPSVPCCEFGRVKLRSLRAVEVVLMADTEVGLACKQLVNMLCTRLNVFLGGSTSTLYRSGRVRLEPYRASSRPGRQRPECGDSHFARGDFTKSSFTLIHMIKSHLSGRERREPLRPSCCS
jgi:hypothetical protein